MIAQLIARDPLVLLWWALTAYGAGVAWWEFCVFFRGEYWTWAGVRQGFIWPWLWLKRRGHPN